MKPKIICCGDIHIFNAKRFEEHKHVFSRFYADIEKEKPDVIVVTGDVVDSKIRLSPEQVSLTYEFLENLTKFAHVIMIPGNHDKNLANKDRMDALTPIVDALKGKKLEHDIFYLTKSGVYQMFDINWAVWSCFEDQKNPFEVSGKKSGYTIGLYHGIVTGSQTNSGFSLEGMHVDEFDGCDIVMMSDVHKQQSFRNGEINYTGSLIQTDVSEEPNGSYLVYEDNGNGGYDLRVRTIKNDYSTISVNIDKVDTVKVLPSQKIRLEFDADKYTRAEVMEVVKNVKANHDGGVLVKARVKKIDSAATIIAKSTSQQTANNVIKNHIEEFLKAAGDRFGFKNMTKDQAAIMELDKKFSQGEINEFEYGDFVPVSITMNNFLSFGAKDNTIDFPNGLIGIFGKNRVGKSSVIKAIQFVLFNETPNNVSALKLINKHNRSLPAFVSIKINKAGKIYLIKRTIVPDKKGAAATVALTFHEVDSLGNELNNLTKESRPYTETEIKRYFGINETFEMLSLFSAQKRQTEYIDCKNAERLKLVNKFLGLQPFELKEKNVLDELKEKNAVFSNLQKQLEGESSLSNIEKSINKAKALLKIATSEQIEVMADIQELDESYKGIIQLYDSTLHVANKTVHSAEEINQKIEAKNKELAKLDSHYAYLGNRITESDAEIDRCCKEFEENHGVNPADYKPDNKEVIAIESKRAVIDHDIKRLNSQLGIDVCNSCGKEFTEDEKSKVRGKLNELNQEKINLLGELEAVQTKNTQISNEIKFMENLLDAKDDYSKELLKTENTINKEKVAISDLKNAVNDYNVVQDAKQVIASLEDSVTEYKKEKKELESELNSHKQNVGIIEARIKDQENKMAQLQKKIKEFEELEDEIRLLKAYRKIVNKDGLPLYILNSKISEINDKVNLIVNQVFDFQVIFSIDNEKGDLKIHFSYDGDPDGNEVSLASGSETFIINICIKAGLAQISNLPKIETFFIDEGYDSLDAESIEKLPALFEALCNYYNNVVTISHLDVVKDMCTSKIALTKENKYTVLA